MLCTASFFWCKNAIVYADCHDNPVPEKPCDVVCTRNACAVEQIPISAFIPLHRSSLHFAPLMQGKMWSRFLLTYPLCLLASHPCSQLQLKKLQIVGVGLQNARYFPPCLTKIMEASLSLAMCTCTTLATPPTSPTLCLSMPSLSLLAPSEDLLH